MQWLKKDHRGETEEFDGGPKPPNQDQPVLLGLGLSYTTEFMRLNDDGQRNERTNGRQEHAWFRRLTLSSLAFGGIGSPFGFGLWTLVVEQSRAEQAATRRGGLCV